MPSSTAAPTVPVRVLVCDDHVVFRRGLRLVLESTADVEVVGEAADTEVAVASPTELGIAENTVKNHVRGVLEKLHVSSRTEAALSAVRQGLTDDP